MLCRERSFPEKVILRPFLFEKTRLYLPPMKRILLTAAAILTLGSFASADEWFTDYAKALLQAKAQNKPVLIDFTGSDWCGWCMKLDKEVFSMDDFKAYAAQKLVLLKIDFPRRKELPAPEKAQNEKLASQFSVRGFPTVIVLKSDGSKAGELGYTPGGPKAFISQLEKVIPRK
jgi:protein disulfide-isomerase